MRRLQFEAAALFSSRETRSIHPLHRMLKQEPDPALSLIDKIFEQARRRDVALLIADFVGEALIHRERFVVFHELTEHVDRIDVGRIVLGDPREAHDLADGADRHRAELPDSLGQDIDHRKELIGLLVEQKMVVTEMLPRHMPVEVLCLEIEGSRIRNERIHNFGDRFSGRLAEIVRRPQLGMG
jgi:hypothetical protein